MFVKNYLPAIIYSFDYDYSDSESTGRNRRIKLNYIFLTGRKVNEAVSRQSKKALAALEALGAEQVVEKV